MRTHARREGGFSALEVVVVLALLGLATLGMAHTIVSGQRSLKFVEEDSQVLDHAHILMSRLLSIPFQKGSGGDTPATPTQILELIALETDLFSNASMGSGNQGGAQLVQQFQGLSSNSDMTLTALRMTGPISWAYDQAGGQDYGPPGVWEIRVDTDLDGSGDAAGGNAANGNPFEPATGGGGTEWTVGVPGSDTDPTKVAGYTGLLRIEIKFNGRRILRTYRSEDPEE